MKKGKKFRMRLKNPINIDQRAYAIEKEYQKIKNVWVRTNKLYDLNVPMPSKQEMLEVIQSNREPLSIERIHKEMGLYYKDYFEDVIDSYKPRSYKQAEVIQERLSSELGIHATINDIMMGNLPAEALQAITTGRVRGMAGLSFYGS